MARTSVKVLIMVILETVSEMSVTTVQLSTTRIRTIFAVFELTDSGERKVKLTKIITKANLIKLKEWIC